MGQSTSKASGAVSKASNSKSAMLDYPLDQENRAKVISHLESMDFPIVAVWIVARPINWKQKSKIEHWSVISEAKGCLLLIDFLEHNNKGAFRLKARTETHLEEFENFFKWAPPQEIQQNDNNQAPEGTPYRIVASVTPHPLIPSQGKYKDYIDNDEAKKIAKMMKQNKKLKKSSSEDLKENLSDNLCENINIDKSIKDIGDFLSRWTELDEQKNKSKISSKSSSEEEKEEAKLKPYNVISHNCQQFALELFEDLVGKKYGDKVKFASEQILSPMDKK